MSDYENEPGHGDKSPIIRSILAFRPSGTGRLSKAVVNAHRNETLKPSAPTIGSQRADLKFKLIGRALVRDPRRAPLLPVGQLQAHPLPDWPAMLSRTQLCLYLGVSWATLKGVLTVRPVDMGASVIRYRRDQIDEWVRSRPQRAAKALGPTPEPQGPPAETPEQDARLLALARAKKRLETRG